MKTTALIALAGIAAAATAQSANITITTSSASVAAGESFTVTVNATGTSGVVAFDILVSALEGQAGITGISNLTGLGSFFGAPVTIAGADSAAFSAAGNLFGGSPAAGEISGNLFSFDVATDENFLGDISFGAAEGAQSASFVTFGTAGFPTVLNAYQEVNVAGATVAVVPTPAAAGLLGLGGLVATRRRR